MTSIALQPPSLEGLGLDAATEAAFGAWNAALQQALVEFGEQVLDPKNFVIHTQGGSITLADLKDFLPFRGMVAGFHGSWSQAAIKPGWVLCDGRNGTPKIHPAPNTTDFGVLQRFIRGVEWGKKSGTVGGAETHVHDPHTPEEIVAVIKDHVTHTHTVSGSTGTGSCTCVQSGSGVMVSPWDHTHWFSATTSVNDLASRQHAVQGDDIEHSASYNIPPYIDLIFLMKD